MKIQVKTYTFDASAKTVTFGDYPSIDLDGVLLITNVTDNIIIYNFADQGFGGTVSGNVLTLAYDTTSMDDADKLQIFYEDPDTNPVTEALIETLNELASRLGVLVGMSDGKASLRVIQAVAGTAQAVTLASTAISAVTTLGGMSSQELQRVNSGPVVILGNINNVATS